MYILRTALCIFFCVYQMATPTICTIIYTKKRVIWCFIGAFEKQKPLDSLENRGVIYFLNLYGFNFWRSGRKTNECLFFSMFPSCQLLFMNVTNQRNIHKNIHTRLFSRCGGVQTTRPAIPVYPRRIIRTSSSARGPTCLAQVLLSISAAA